VLVLLEEKRVLFRTTWASKIQQEMDNRVFCSFLHADQDIAESSAKHVQLGLSSLLIHMPLVSHVSTSQNWHTILKKPKVQHGASTSACII